MKAFSNTTGGKLEAAFINGDLKCFQITRQNSIFFVLNLYMPEENNKEWYQSFLDESQKSTNKTCVIASHEHEEPHNFIVNEVNPLDSNRPCLLIVKLKEANSRIRSVVQSRRV